MHYKTFLIGYFPNPEILESYIMNEVDRNLEELAEEGWNIDSAKIWSFNQRVYCTLKKGINKNG